MYILAADIGGTNSRFALSEIDRPYEYLIKLDYESQNYADFSMVLEEFLHDSGIKLDDAILSLALPGVLTETGARLTNLPWIIDKAWLCETYHLSEVILLNDFQAIAEGVSHLNTSDWLPLIKARHTGALTNDCRVVAGAGTGLGVAWQVTDGMGDRSCIYTTEGGHINFAPTDVIQCQLLEYLLQQTTSVSYEMVLSGSGIVTIYQFLTQGKQVDKSEVSAGWIYEQASQRTNEQACLTLDIFTRIYGAFIGNLALLYKPAQGIFIAGGIANKIRSWMASNEFCEPYFNKGVMKTLNESINVNLITNDRVGVIGATAVAVSGHQEKNVCR